MTAEHLYHEKAERCVLGCVLYDNRVLAEVAPLLSATDFYRESHRHIWRAMLALDDDRRAIDALTLVEQLRAMLGDPEGIGGPAYIARLTDQVPSAANAEHYAHIVREKAMLRRARQTANGVAQRIDAGQMDVDEALGELAGAVDALSQQEAKGEDVSIKAAVQEFVTRLEARYNGEEPVGISTGVDPVDELLGGGVTPQRMIGIAARPKHGKSKLAGAILGHLCWKHGYPADVWYVDGARENVVRELTAWRSNINTEKLQHGRDLTEVEWARATRDLAEMADLDVNLYARGRPRVRDIARTTRARASRMGGKPFVVVIDYLQKCTAGLDSEYDDVTEVCKRVADLKEIPGLILLCLLQFNRKATGGKVPRPDHLRASGQLEQDLDHLLIWHRPAFAELEDSNGDITSPSAEELREGVLWHALTKHNSTGMQSVYCDLATNRFRHLSHRSTHVGQTYAAASAVDG